MWYSQLYTKQFELNTFEQSTYIWQRVSAYYKLRAIFSLTKFINEWFMIKTSLFFIETGNANHFQYLYPIEGPNLSMAFNESNNNTKNTISYD